VASLYLANRLDVLRRAQNADGGWAFYAGKQNSWLEPTVYAALALDGEPASERAWNLIQSWQLPDGSWKAAANVAHANWTSSLAALLAAAKGAPSAKGLAWLEQASRGGGWAWHDESGPSAEPTAWSVLAMLKGRGAADRISPARSLLLAEALTPELAGLLLLVMQGTAAPELKVLASGWLAQTGPGVARARLVLGLRLHGVDVPEPEDGGLHPNLAVTALEALGAREGRHALLRTGVA
jgi:hypothetical protein